MIKINKKTRKIKRTKKFNRKQNKVLIGGRGQLSQDVKLKITYVIFESVKQLLTDYNTEINNIFKDTKSNLNAENKKLTVSFNYIPLLAFDIRLILTYLYKMRVDDENVYKIIHEPMLSIESNDNIKKIWKSIIWDALSIRYITNNDRNGRRVIDVLFKQNNININPNSPVNLINNSDTNSINDLFSKIKFYKNKTIHDWIKRPMYQELFKNTQDDHGLTKSNNNISFLNSNGNFKLEKSKNTSRSSSSSKKHNNNEKPGLWDRFKHYISLKKSNSSQIVNNKELNIEHIWYKDWPDEGVPENIQNFKLFCEKLKQNIIQNGKDVTTLIHCSAGVGRTGTVYVILYLMFKYDINNCNELMTKMNSVNKLIVDEVIETIEDARKYRTAIVQNGKQFQFILKVFGINIDLDKCIIQHKKIKNYDTNNDKENKCLIAKKCSNSNRYDNILPFDEHIVTLTPENDKTVECKDYINASLMKDFKGGFKVIAAQCPLSDENNIRNFNRMLFEHNVGIIAMLTKLEERNINKCTDYTTDTNLSLDTENIGILVRTLNLQKNKDVFTFTQKSKPSNYLEIN
jgi:protein tyrosine phosphatase